MDSTSGWHELRAAAATLAQQLTAADQKLVLAESCTCGLVAAALGSIPGISAHLCGSAVVYRETTKIAWLGISPPQLARETAVSPGITAALAEQVLRRTPESDWGVAVTGHLGPAAPAALDGQVHVAIARRQADQIAVIGSHTSHLTARERSARQFEAAEAVLRAAHAALQSAQLR